MSYNIEVFIAFPRPKKMKKEKRKKGEREEGKEKREKKCEQMIGIRCVNTQLVFLYVL